MEERLLNMDKYFEGVTSKKQKRSELTINSNTGALNMKITNRMKSVNQSVEDQPKNIYINKHTRTSMAEFQAECQINGLKNKPVTMAKDVNTLKDNGEKSDKFEKTRRLAAIEEGWDKKNKRKRSIGPILLRPNDSDDVIPKRATQNRSSNCDDSYTPLTKKKALRTTQIGWEKAIAKETLISQESDHNHKPSFGQWAGQRQPKLPRTSRSNNGTHDSPVPRNAPTNGSLKLTVKLDNYRSEIKESGGGERKMKGKMGNNHVEDIGPSEGVINEESVWRKGRSARGLLISRCNSMSPSPMENDSKSGRRLKRLSESKCLSNNAPLQNSSSPDFTECSSQFRKKTELSFSPISNEEKSSLTEEFPCEERKTHTPHQRTESFFKKHNMDYKTHNLSTPFYQRVLSALIIEDDDDDDVIDEFQEVDARNMKIQNSFSSTTSDTYHHNDIEPRKKGRVESKCDTMVNMCGQSQRLAKSFHGCSYEQMSVDEKLLLELQSIGLCPDAMPDLEDNEDEMVPHEVDNLHQQVDNKNENLATISGVTRVIRTATKPPRAPKPSQKTNLPLTREGKFVDKPATPPHNKQPSVNNNRRDVGGRSEVNDETNPLPLTSPLEELEGVDELGVMGGPHDLSSLLIFDEEVDLDLDLDFEEGLAVPDDDLMELGFI